MKRSSTLAFLATFLVVVACNEHPTNEPAFQEVEDAAREISVPLFRNPVAIFPGASFRTIMPTERLSPIGFKKRFIYGFGVPEPLLEDGDLELPMMVAADGGLPDPDCEYNVHTSSQEQREAYTECANSVAPGSAYCVEERYYGGTGYGDVHLHCYSEGSLIG